LYYRKGPKENLIYMETSQKQAFQAMDRAAEKAKQLGVNANIAILDTAGYLKSFLRMDEAFLGSIDIALGKAKTAMLFRMNSEAVGEFLRPEAQTYGMVSTSGGLVGFIGGMPVKSAGEIVAYIGVSGGRPDQDFAIATAGSVL
jgi:uncharacterized protein GlcG (DUF336 family)